MSDDIKTSEGRVVGSWDGKSAEELKQELARIMKMLAEDGMGEKLIAKEMPHREQLHPDLKAFNAQLRKAQARLGWSEVRDMLSINHGRLVAFIEGSDEARLYGGPMPGGGSKWPTGRWAEAAGASHYRSAGKWIRACLRAEKAS